MLFPYSALICTRRDVLNLAAYMFEPPAQANNDINIEEGSGESEGEDDRLDRRQSTIW